MSLAELEEAVEELSIEDFSHFRKWLDFDSLKMQEFQARKREALIETAGCLAGEEGDEFARNVEEAGKGMADDHSW